MFLRNVYFTLWLASLIPFCFAAQDITVDDTDSSIQYSGPWDAGQTCSGCSLQPDPSQMFDGTWHDSTYDSTQVKRPGQPGFTYQFDGTAISVYCALPIYIEWVTVATQLNFFIDGVNLTSQAYYWTAVNGTTDYQYNVRVFASNTLSSDTHVLTVESWAAFLFDYMVYTPVDIVSPPPSPTSNPPPPPPPPTASPTSENAEPTASPIAASTGTPLITLSTSTTTSPPVLSSVFTSSSPNRIPVSSSDTLSSLDTPSSSDTSSSSSSITTPFTFSSRTVGFTSTSPSPSVSSAVDTSGGQQSSHHLMGAIIGGTAGVMSVLVLTSVVLLCRRRQQRASRANGPAETDPYMDTVLSPSIPSEPSTPIEHPPISETLVTSEYLSAPTSSGSSSSPHTRDETQSMSDTLLDGSLLADSSSADKADAGAVRISRIASSSRSTRDFAHARSAAPSYSEVQSISWERATRRERAEEIQRMHLQIDAMASSPSDDSRGRRAENEIMLLRAYVAQLETQLYGAWIASDDDEPPPEY